MKSRRSPADGTAYAAKRGMIRGRLALIALGLELATCNGASTKIDAPEPTLSPESDGARHTGVGAAAPSSSAKQEAHRRVIAAIACWLGNLWSEAESSDEASRELEAEQRCEQLSARSRGSSDRIPSQRLRSLEPAEVARLRNEILAIASVDSADRGRVPQLAAFFDAAANAERENVIGRRAGERVRKSATQRESLELTISEVSAVEPLNDARAFEALFRLDVGDLNHEVRAVAILCAMDRMQAARGLTENLKVYALARPFALLFNIPAPKMPVAARQVPAARIWASYIAAVAAAAGHPVPAAAKSPSEREVFAWRGALRGLADRLHTEAAQMSDETELKRVAETVARRLDAEYLASEAALPQLSQNDAAPRDWRAPATEDSTSERSKATALGR